MSNLPKLCLAISVAAFAVGITDAGSEIAWGLLKPVSAVFFGLFFMTKILEKEVAQYDEENRLNLARLAPQIAPSAAGQSCESSRTREPRAPAVAAPRRHEPTQDRAKEVHA